jgi:hypothetical protein
MAVLAGLIVVAAGGTAATISWFDAFAAPSTPFTITDFSSTADFSTAQASIFATITCTAETTCSGEAIRYIMSFQDVTPQTEISAEIVGNASAPTTGSFVWSASGSTYVFGTTPFSFGSGAFDQSVLNTFLPVDADGVGSSGSLFLTMAAGQSITLPLNIADGPTVVPEPGSLALFGLGLFGIAANFLRRRERCSVERSSRLRA